VLGLPIRHNESLEAEFALENVVLEVRVLAKLRVVRLVVGAHNGASSSADGVSERPEVQLVQSLVVHIAADSINKAEVLELSRRTEVLLLVVDVVLSASNDTSILDTTNSLSDSMASQVGIGREALPVATTLGVATKWTNSRTQLNINTLGAVL